MNDTLILIADITVENRKRPVDLAVVADLQKSIEQQGLLQNIGVKQTESGYRLVFGAHRLAAAKNLDWTEIQARVFPAETSDDECLLAELQENRIRNDLTGAERKAFAAEVGRLILKLRGNSNLDSIPIWNDTWLLELADKSGMGKSSAYNWWSAFTKSAGLSITPKQATDENRQAFFAWLEAQKQAEDAEKSRKAEEAEAEKKRKEAAAYKKRMEAEKKDFMEYIDATAQEWGETLVRDWIQAWLEKSGGAA
jgi:hypothetical protein